MKKILLVDDHPMLREGLHRLIDPSQGNLAICAEAGTAKEAMEAVQNSVPDLIITDISLPDKNGLELIKELKSLWPSLKILVFSMHDEMVYAERCIKAGAMGYLMKGARTPLLLKAIERVMDGSTYLSQRMADHLLTNLAGQRASGLRINNLSDRELEIFELIGHCHSNTDISQMLHISTKTVDAHRSNIKTKLNLPDAQTLMREAVLWVQKIGESTNEG